MKRLTRSTLKVLFMTAAFFLIALFTACGRVPDSDDTLQLIETEVEVPSQVSAETPTPYVELVETPSQIVAGWTTIAWPGWFSVCIPSDWETDTYVTYDSPESHLRVFGNGDYNDTIEIFIFGSPLSVATLYIGLNETPNRERFQFDDGSVGYMVKDDFWLNWYHTEWGVLHIIFGHEENQSSFTDNEDLILRIVRTVQRHFVAREQEQFMHPFRGSADVESLLWRRETIEEWIRHIPFPSVAFRFYPESETGYVILDISLNDRLLSRLVLESQALFEQLSERRELEFKTNTLPTEYLTKRVVDVRHFDFEGMGTFFFLNADVRKGTHVDQVRLRFLDTGTDENVMYTRIDVDPRGDFSEDTRGDILFIGGEYRPGGASSIAHGYPRELYYEYTIPTNGRVYTIYCRRTFILLPIDENGNVAGLIWGVLTQLN